MPSESTGKKYTIKSIKFNKDNVTLTFIKYERVQISKDAYLSTYLYEGKGLSKREIDKLIELSAYAELSNYALKLLNKRRYSEKAFYEKLKAKDNNKEIINAIIKKYKKNGLLDDKSFMEDLIAWDDERLFGKNKTLKHLKDEGIPEALISKAHFSSSNELKKAKGLLPKLDKKYAKYAYQSKKRHIFDALINQGYEIDVAKLATEGVKEDKPKVARAKLSGDFTKIKKRYEKKYDGYELKKRIYAALVNKGYKHSEIKEFMEGMNDENDF